MKTPENILDDNKVRVAGSMQNRILLAMNDYAKQECSRLTKWISIRDKRPDYMQTCIIHANIGFVTMAQYGGGSPGKEVFVHNQEWYTATHWMPLPEPPQNQ